MSEINKGGRPTMYKEEYNEKVFKLCLLGATDKEIADFLDVDVATINNWKIKHPKFVESIKEGKVEADAKVANSLYNRATGYRYKEEASTKDGIQELEKYAHPDTAAAFIWLKNRQPKKWRDKQEIEHSGTIAIDEKSKEIESILFGTDE